ncbi:MAG: acyl carrier protein [Chitinophagaceae bacterium]|nr:acyl carrier protein [Chitinophagaceae bacterium]
MKDWFIEKIAEEASISVAEVDCDRPFQEYNMDSLAIISLCFEMEDKFGLENTDPSMLSEYNTINKLVQWVEAQRR